MQLMNAVEAFKDAFRENLTLTKPVSPTLKPPSVGATPCGVCGQRCLGEGAHKGPCGHRPGVRTAVPCAPTLKC